MTRYSPTSTAVPRISPAGKARCGSRVSPAENVTHCHPSYAQSTPTTAAPTPESSDGAGRPSAGTALPSTPAWPNARSTAASATRAPAFTAALAFCTLALSRAPATFTAAMTTIIVTAAIRAPAPPMGTISRR